MNDNQERNQLNSVKLGWAILIAISALLIFAGINWFIELPNLALDNIAERISLDPSGFRQGNPSAFDVISLIARLYGIGYAAFGLLALLVALEGYRHGSQWAWKSMWVLVVVIMAVAANFMLVGGVSAYGLGILGIAAVALAGQLLARQRLSRPET